ncbi:hypothetical protein L4D76_26645 [Photobacterium sagamiensis]|uniref:hypothetical protein n=1 Tax=Photobacterium sagamiensis TaxID=2910241 RepID=UPI003D10C1BB
MTREDKWQLWVQIKPFTNGEWSKSLVRFGHAQEREITLENGDMTEVWKPEQAHVYLLKNIEK